jgi:hypothetical protein
MEYGIELQYIIDELRQDKTANPKWRNKVIARLEEIQVFMLMLHEQPSFDTMPLQVYDEAGYIDPEVMAQIKPVTMDQVPASLREFADPGKLQSNPDQPTV